jgi:hypothetical protein
MKKVFLKPVENSNGFLEKGVGIVKFNLVLKENNAMVIEHVNKMTASRNKFLYRRIEKKGMQTIEFSKTLILFFDLSPKVDIKNSVLLFSESLN